MLSNVEIKARVHDPVALERAAAIVADGRPVLLEQEDVFFRVPRGRLKLRTFADASAELIYYERPDEPGPRPSMYSVVDVADGPGLREALARALGVKGTVRKRRSLYMAGQTRIHLDHVEDLGDFLELEVVLQPGQSADEGRDIARTLMDSLGVSSDDLVSSAYIDLLCVDRNP